MNKKVLFILLGMIMTVQIATAQNNKDYKETPYWVEMMQEPSVNYAEAQDAFYTYWEGREITKGSGYKPFKRWEYFWKSRLTPEGNLPAPGYLWDIYNSMEQTKDTELGNWVNLGPIQQGSVNGTGQPNGNGRINAVGFHPTDENTFYAGAPAGGLWKTTDGGQTWSTNTDDLPTLGVSAILVDYDNPDVIYLGTGDRDAGDAAGVGVMKTTDGGENWVVSNNGLGNRTVGRMVMDPSDNKMIYAATSGGIYKTDDSGENWVNKQNGNFKDLVFHPTNPDILYAATGGSFYRSDDAGETWTSNAPGYGGGARAVIAVSPDEPDYVYALTSNGSYAFKGLYKSTDAGLTFTEQSASSPNIMDWSCGGSGSGGQGWYDLELACDPLNADVIYTGGVNIWKSTDGGVNWNIRAHWVGDCGVAAVHADHHVMEYNPLNNRLYDGNDGGLYWTEDGGVIWNEITSGIAVSQVYKLGQSATERDYVINGYQDNGTGVFEGESEGWMTVYGGDGMDCLVDWEDGSYAYGELYYGSIFRLKNSNAEGTVTQGISESGNWVTPFVLHEGDPNTMFVGMNNIWRTKNVRANTWSIEWEKISDFTGAKFDVLEHSKANDDILYAARGNSLFVSLNASDDNPSWSTIGNGLGGGSSTINDIESHPFMDNIVFVSKGSGVYMSEDNGTIWSEITGNLPESTVSTIEYYEGSYNGLYAGTDLGIYFMDESMEEWLNYSNGYPLTAPTTDLEIFYDPTSPDDHVIRVSTYGRGMWESPVYIGAPIADFTSSEIEVAAGCTVDFIDMSTGTPYTYNWTFEGGDPSTSNEQHPSDIAFPNPGQYSITLEVINPNGNDTKTITQMITVIDGQAPVVDFYADNRSFCNGEYITTLHDNSSFCPSFWEWSFEPNTVEFLEGTDANSANPVVKFLDDASYDVTLVAGNVAGTSSITFDDYISSAGFVLPFVEDFSNGFDYSDWVIENPDSQGTWEITEIDGNAAAKLSFFNYNAPPGRMDELISPVLNFSGLDNVYLHFRHAYAQRVSAWSDSLFVYVSPNCGNNWVKVFTMGEDEPGDFATIEPMATEFIPTSNEEWCEGSYSAGCTTIDLTSYAGSNKMMVKFVSFNNNGNNLFIDDIVFNNTIDVELTEEMDDKLRFKLYPNPSDDMVNVLVSGVKEDMILEVLSVHGQLILSKEVKGTETTYFNSINLSNIEAGMYIVNLKSNQTTLSKKLIVK